MRRLPLFLILTALISVSVKAQYSSTNPMYQTGAPSGTCYEKVIVDRVTGIEYTCVSGTWTAQVGLVTGPASSTDNAITRFDGTGGKTLQNSGVTIDDSNNVAGTASVTPGTAGTGDVGSATKPYGFIFFSGSSGTPGTNNFKFIGASTSGTRTISAPDANTLLPIFSQRVTFTGPSVARSYVLPDTDTTICGTNSVCAGYQAGPLTGDVTTSGAAATIAAGAVTEAKQTLADNTTLDVSITKHGYVPKAPNDSAKFLNGLGAWAVPPSGITGSGTQNTLAKFGSGGTSVGDSQITDDGTIVAIGQSALSQVVLDRSSVHSPSATLGVTGDSGVALILSGTDGSASLKSTTNNVGLTIIDGTSTITEQGVNWSAGDVSGGKYVAVNTDKFEVTGLGLKVAALGGSGSVLLTADGNGDIGKTSFPLSPASGGTGQDFSGSTGIPALSGGVWGVPTNSAAALLGSYLGVDYTNATASFTNTALSVTLDTGARYSFLAQIFVSDSVAADGFSVDFNGGSATTTNFIAGTSTSLVTGVTTSLSGAFSNGTVTGTNLLTISGSITVNAGGTFIVRAKQSSHTAGTLTISQGSSITFTKIP